MKNLNTLRNNTDIIDNLNEYKNCRYRSRLRNFVRYNDDFDNVVTSNGLDFEWYILKHHKNISDMACKRISLKLFRHIIYRHKIHRNIYDKFIIKCMKRGKHGNSIR